MFKRKLTHCIFVAILALVSCNTDNTKVSMPEVLGVWANDYCELIRTQKYRLLILKKGEHFLVTLEELHYNDKILSVETKLSARFGVDNKAFEAIGSSLKSNGRLLINNSEALNLESRLYALTSDSSESFYTNKGKIFEQINSKGELQIITNEGLPLRLQCLHRIKPVGSYAMTDARSSNIGICIQEWLSGVQVYDNEDYSSLHINIKNYNCLLGYGKFMGNDIVYVRTANFSTNNKGMVFDQKIRLMHNDVEHTAWMIGSHAEELYKLPEIRIDNFTNPDLVKINSDNYWQMVSFNEDQIKLKNNSNRIYVINKPKKESTKQLEWFDFNVVFNENNLMSVK